MKVNLFARYVLSCVAAAMLAGCGESQPPIGAPGPMPQGPSFSATANREASPSTLSSGGTAAHSRLRYRLLYSFKGWLKDGQYPAAGLTDVNGRLYGTTFLGGRDCKRIPEGCGTIFDFTESGKEFILRSFGHSSAEGDYPAAGLLASNGAL